MVSSVKLYDYNFVFFPLSYRCYCKLYEVCLGRLVFLSLIILTLFYGDHKSWGLLLLRLATSWTVRGSNPGGGEIFSIRPDRPWGLPSLLYNGYRVIPGGKATGAWR
jgi:hypothetical protein